MCVLIVLYKRRCVRVFVCVCVFVCVSVSYDMGLMFV